MQAANEAVPNVREACVKTERDIAMKFDKGPVRENIKKHISSMTEDQDFEVKHTALQAVEKLWFLDSDQLFFTFLGTDYLFILK